MADANAGKTPEEIEEFIRKLISINKRHLDEAPLNHPLRYYYRTRIEAYENILYFMGVY